MEGWERNTGGIPAPFLSRRIKRKKENNQATVISIGKTTAYTRLEKTVHQIFHRMVWVNLMG
jgi:hypothetical protein